MTRNKTYFISDIHLGLPNHQKSLERERQLVDWLKSIQAETEALYLMGDVFDFWYEYKWVVPKGYVRFLSAIAEFTDQGIPVYFFTGNHDIWAFDYLEKELGVQIIRKPVTHIIHQRSFHLAHGDGLGPKDYVFKALRKVFHSKTAQFLFSRLHPNFALWLGNTWSRKKRYSEEDMHNRFLGEDKEWLILYTKEMQKKQPADYYIFGHRHLALNLMIDHAQFVNLGEWIHQFTYAVFDQKELKLKNIQGKEFPIGHC